MKKVTKGKAGYLAEKKKRLGLQALAEFAVVALILIIGYVITKTRLNIFTVVAIVGGGYGHGIGMSQNGANEMAKNGKNYMEILKLFYQNVEIR